MSDRVERIHVEEAEPCFLDYELPQDRIAQFPLPDRAEARLLVVDRARGTLTNHIIKQLPQLLHPNDLLILNDTRVLPARLRGIRAATGGKWEGLFLRERPDGKWEMLCQSRGRLRAGETIRLRGASWQLVYVEPTPDGGGLFRPEPPGHALDLLSRCGEIPLPPYIRKGMASPADADRYQTVFASVPGAVAAPTAGLHFTRSVLDELQAHGIAIAYLTLHVGAGTFRPLPDGDYRAHQLHSEAGTLPQATVEAIECCRARGGRVVAVGTTCARVLETAAADGKLAAWRGETRLFIHPPYRFKVVNALLTNFHLPGTSLLLLVDAFATSKLTRTAYETAIAGGYRFYSYGDAMLIV